MVYSCSYNTLLLFKTTQFIEAGMLHSLSQGVLCHLPPNFFDQRSIWTASRLEDIATQNSCILEPLMGE